MGVNKAIRADDVSGLNIATVENVDTDAITKDFQRVVLNDPTTAGNMAGVDGSGNLKVTGTVAVSGTVAVKPTDGTNALSKTFDLDTSGSTHEWNIGVGLRKSASGGSVELGTNTNPVRVDTTGTTTQPVSIAASVTVAQATASNLKVDLSGTAANATAIKVDGSAAIQPVSGTVTANIGSSGSLALDASVTGLQVAQGSTTSGEKGSLVQGAVTTAAPSYTTAQTSPLSLDVSGNLRTSVSNTVAVSGTVTTTPPSNASSNVAQFGGTNVSTGTGTGGAGIPRVTVSNDSNVLTTQSGTWTVQPGNTANTTAWKVDGSAVTQPVSIAATVAVQPVGNGTLLSNQQAVTASAVALATNSCRRVAVKALTANSINVYVGPSGITTSTGYELGPGESIALNVTNTNLVFVIASTTGASVSWVATN